MNFNKNSNYLGYQHFLRAQKVLGGGGDIHLYLHIQKVKNSDILYASKYTFSICDYKRNSIVVQSLLRTIELKWSARKLPVPQSRGVPKVWKHILTHWLGRAARRARYI